VANAPDAAAGAPEADAPEVVAIASEAEASMAETPSNTSDTAAGHDAPGAAEGESARQASHEEDASTLDEEGEDSEEDVEPIELLAEGDSEEEPKMDWYILKVQVNREESIRDALLRRVKIEGLDRFFGEVVVPTEDVAEFTKAGKRRIVKKKLYPGYLMIHMAINDDTWFLVRETPGIGDFTGSAGRPAPMLSVDVERILRLGKEDESGEQQIKTAIPFRVGDHVRIKEGNFENFEGDVDNVDEAKGRVTVKINIFGRSTPVEFEHWQIESI